LEDYLNRDNSIRNEPWVQHYHAYPFWVAERVVLNALTAVAKGYKWQSKNYWWSKLPWTQRVD